jgi:protein-disulfide isomerase
VSLSLLFGGVLAGIVILSLGKPQHDPLVVRGTDTVQRLYGGIEQEGAALGPAQAPVSISVYDDLQCRGCSAWYLRTVPPLVEELVRTRKAKLVYHHFPMGQREREVAFPAAAAAGEQGRQWQYVHIFFANQEEARRRGVSEEFMTRVAEQVPELEVDQWKRDRRDPDIERTLAADAKLSLDERLPAQPAVIVDGPRGQRKLVGSPTAARILAAANEVG